MNKIPVNTSGLTQFEVETLLAEAATGECDMKRLKSIWEVFFGASQSILANFSPNHTDGIFQRELSKDSAMRSILRASFFSIAGGATPCMLTCLSPLFFVYCCRDVTNPDIFSGFDLDAYRELVLRSTEITGNEVLSEDEEPHSSVIEMVMKAHVAITSKPHPTAHGMAPAKP